MNPAVTLLVQGRTGQQGKDGGMEASDLERCIDTGNGSVPHVRAGRLRVALSSGALGACLMLLSSVCHALEPEPLKTDQSFISEIEESMKGDLGGDYGGARAVRFDILMDWSPDLIPTLGSRNTFILERATHFLKVRLQELGIDYIDIQPDPGTPADVCRLLDVQIRGTLRRVAQPGSGTLILVGSLNLGIARGHPRGSKIKGDLCKYEYETRFAGANFFLPEDDTREAIERALEPALLNGIDELLVWALTVSDPKVTQRVRGWSKAP